jgi:hypothetical protein
VAHKWLYASRSFTEADALAELWALGEDAWLREDRCYSRCRRPHSHVCYDMV